MPGPNFFIIGAPKCGTTSLAHWLAAHPSVFVSPIKEPHFYSTDLANRTIKTAARYAELFAGADTQHAAVGEASTWYLFSREAVSLIEREHPQARYVVMTRDPVAMAQSLYHHNVRVLHEYQPTFERAWRLQDARARGEQIPSTCVEPLFLQYRAACALGTLMQRLLAQVPAERVLHVPLDAMQTDPAEQYRAVLAFLGVKDDGRSEFPVYNVARGSRSRLLQRALRAGARLRVALGINRGLGLGRLNEQAKAKRPLSPAMLAELDEAFAEERKMLHELTGCVPHAAGEDR